MENVFECLQEKLFSMLKKDVSKNNPSVDVVKLQRSGGVVSRNAKFRQRTRSYRTRVTHLFSSLCRIYLSNE